MTDPMPEQDAVVQTFPGDETFIPVPSGQPVYLHDVIWNVPGPDGLAARFRFIAPQIARETGTIGYEQAAEDIFHLCQTYALPRLTDFGPQPSQVIISFSDQPVPFGETAPHVTQFFEAFTHQDGICIWEIY